MPLLPERFVAHAVTWRRLATPRFAVDPGRVTVTVEPTSAEKQALALVADDVAQLHVPLLDLADAAAFTPDDRIAIGTALSNVAATTPPLSGAISGTGWLSERGVTVGIVDCPGLGILRGALCDALYDIAPEPGEFLPVVVLTSGSVDATSIAGMPVHFNELRVRVGAETLVFDLLGPIPGAPEPELAEPETPPAEPEPAPEPEPVVSPEEAPAMTTTTRTTNPAVVTLAEDSPGDVPTDAPPPPLLADVPDGELESEIARRAAEIAAAGDPEGDPTALLEAAEAEAAGVIVEIADELAGVPAAPTEDVPPEAPMEMAARTKTFAGDDLVPDEAEPGAAFDWEGVLALEDTPTSDGRMFAAGALVWRTLPLTLALQTVTAQGHDGAVVCGSIVEIERVGQTIVGRGRFSSTEAGQLARTLIEEGSLKGVSIDVAGASVIYTDESGAEVTEDDLWTGEVEGMVTAVFVEAELMGATLTPWPAFAETSVGLVETALVATGAPGCWTLTGPAIFHLNTDTEALVASAAPTIPAPSADLFNLRPGTDEPFHVGKPLSDGTTPCYGVIAYWGECHIGYDGKCVTPPANDDFSGFYVGSTVLTAEGTLIPTGVLFMDTVHPDLRKSASDAQAHYADTGCAVADVRLYNGEHGIVAAGVLRPDVDDITAYRLRGSRVSGDWRPTSRGPRMAALLAVNAGGFGRKPLVEGIAASAGTIRPWALLDAEGEALAMVAVGARHHEPTAAEYQADLEARLAALEARIDAMADPHPTLLEAEADDGPVELSADERVARAAAALGALGVTTKAERRAQALAAMGLCTTCE